MRPLRQLLSLSFAFLFLISVNKTSPLLAQTSAPAQEPATNSAPGQTASASAQNEMPQEWADAVRSLARKIKEAMDGSRALTLEFQNISSISDANAGAIQGALKEDLSREHLELTEAASDEATKVRVTFSENQAAHIWTAEIQKGDLQKVVIVSVRKILAPDSGLTPAPVLQKRVVFQQTAPILDFEIEEPQTGTNSGLEFRDVLTPTGLVRYQFQGNRLQLQLPDFAAVHIGTHNSRNLRGRILRSGSQEIRFFIGGSLCVAGPVSDCNDNSTVGWPINPSGTNWAAAYEANRNYFKEGGIYSGEVNLGFPAFYSAAVFAFDRGSLFVLTGLDGKARMFTSTVPSATYAGWGDDVVSLGKGCDFHLQALVSGTGDWTQADYLQLYELDSQHAVAVGQPLQFSGPITAVWPSDDGKSARVVSRDLATGLYEASIVTVVCNN